MWFGIAAAPIAWTLQFIFAFAISDAACNVNGRRWGLPIDAWAIVAMVFAAAFAAAGTASALATFRRAREAEDDDPPPGGVAHFFATVGLTTSPLFFVMILMTGFGVVFLRNCVQA
jgi:hypothetical protein